MSSLTLFLISSLPYHALNEQNHINACSEVILFKKWHMHSSVHAHHLYIWPSWFDVKGISIQVCERPPPSVWTEGDYLRTKDQSPRICHLYAFAKCSSPP